MGLEIFNVNDYPKTDENRVLTSPEEKALFARVVASREAERCFDTQMTSLDLEGERLKKTIEDGKRAKDRVS